MIADLSNQTDPRSSNYRSRLDYFFFSFAQKVAEKGFLMLWNTIQRQQTVNYM